MMAWIRRQMEKRAVAETTFLLGVLALALLFAVLGSAERVRRPPAETFSSSRAAG